VVVIEPQGGRGRIFFVVTVRHARRSPDIGKGKIAVVVIQMILAAGARVGYKNVFKAVVVVVAHGHSSAQPGITLHDRSIRIVELAWMMPVADPSLMRQIFKPWLVASSTIGRVQ